MSSRGSIICTRLNEFNSNDFLELSNDKPLQTLLVSSLRSYDIIGPKWSNSFDMQTHLQRPSFVQDDITMTMVMIMTGRLYMYNGKNITIHLVWKLVVWFVRWYGIYRKLKISFFLFHLPSVFSDVKLSQGTQEKQL